MCREHAWIAIAFETCSSESMNKQGKLIIASDLDGTIIDHTSNKIALAKKLGYSLDSHETSSHAMRNIIQFDAYMSLLTELYGEKTLSADGMEGVVGALGSLVSSFGPVHIISRRGVKSRESEHGLGWVRKNAVPPLEEKNVFFVDEDTEKDIIAKRIGANVYIDDKESVLDKMPSVAHRFLFYPYKKEIKSNYSVVRSWNEFLTICESL